MPQRRNLALAIDIGGTKIACGIVDTEKRVHCLLVQDSPRSSSAEDLISAVVACGQAALLHTRLDDSQIAGVGCGCPGPMVWSAGLASPLNIQAWVNFPIRERLERAFRGPPVFVHNDAIALAVGEHWAGVGRGVNNMIAVTVSTGVGGGLILEGKLIHGSTGNAGHIGHIIIDPSGPVCQCGATGCLEAIASGPSSVRWALANGWRPLDDNAATGKQLAASAYLGDSIARDALSRAGSAVGLAVAEVSTLLDLDVAVVTGGFSWSGPWFWRALRESYRDQVKFSFARQTRVVHSLLGNGAAILGAAAFVLERDRYGWSS